MSLPTNLYDRAGWEQLRRTYRLDPQVLRKLRNDLLKQFHSDTDALHAFAAAET